MSLAIFPYVVTTLAYALLAAVLTIQRESRTHGVCVVCVVAVMAIWGLCVSLISAFGFEALTSLFPAVDAARILVLIYCLLSAAPGEPLLRSAKYPISAAALSSAAIAAGAAFGGLEEVANLALVALALVACFAILRLARSLSTEQETVYRTLLYALGALLLYDVLVFSAAALFDAGAPQPWVLRGLLTGLALPFFVLAAKRHPDWRETLFISRDLVHRAIMLVGVGTYVLAVVLGWSGLQTLGGDWSPSIHVCYFVAASGVLSIALSSTRLKAQLRVFINKHFYRNRYDYRDEWLRLIRTLSDSNQELQIDERSIKALCDVVNSDGGQLWLDRESRSRYEPFASWQCEFPSSVFDESSPLVKFLKRQNWVIDSREYEADPRRYRDAFSSAEGQLPAESLIVPLMHQDELLGILRIKRPAGLSELNFEDHDLLKTAGRQVAAFLAHDLARERLAEARQFHAYHKLAAFVMHDLKNLLAQQALLLNNAKRFKNRPEFVDDVISTVESGVQRMRRLLRNLEHGTAPSSSQRVELGRLILRGVSACSETGSTPCTFTGAPRPLWVHANPDQLTSVLVHVIQNAQDATADGSAVTVTLREHDQRAIIEIRDHGVGMSEEFIRRRLFQPFESTKGSGMGIGAYQAREIVRGVGGDLTVSSEPGRGTLVTIVLPLENIR